MSVPERTLDPESTPHSAAKQRGVRPIVLRLHFYAGVLVAPFILIAAITGALYAIAPTLEQVVYGDVLYVCRRANR
jgi:uncharacterized iron-regulated membrane protein